jgi:CO/xanthine dehydrogenase FAD-binding subunit
LLAPKPKVSRPRDLREALGFAFVHRGRTRWRAGSSPFLGIDYFGDDSADGVVVDVSDVPEFRDVRGDRHALHIGAFADVERIASEPLVRAALGEADFSPAVARFRLAALGANVLIAGAGATRTALLTESLGPDAKRPLAAAEIPIAVELRAGAPPVYFGDRRLRRRDGAATFELRVFVALALAGFHRIGSATVAYSLDGSAPVPLPAVEASLRGSMIGKTTFADAARSASEAFRGDNVHANTLRRTIIPLVLSALKDAHAAARRRAP